MEARCPITNEPCWLLKNLEQMKTAVLENEQADYLSLKQQVGRILGRGACHGESAVTLRHAKEVHCSNIKVDQAIGFIKDNSEYIFNFKPEEIDEMRLYQRRAELT